MGESAKSQIGEKVTVGVITAIIFAGLAYLARNFLLPLLSARWENTKDIVTWFFSGSVASPAWLFCFLSVATLVLLMAIVSKFRNTVKSNAPSWTDYTEDDFFGMKWHWRYTNDNSIGNLRCYCPNDATSLVFNNEYMIDRSTISPTPGVSFHCETCNQKFGPFPGNEKNVRERVERQIDRKVRSNEWQKVISPTLVKA